MFYVLILAVFKTGLITHEFSSLTACDTAGREFVAKYGMNATYNCSPKGSR